MDVTRHGFVLQRRASADTARHDSVESKTTTRKRYINIYF